MIQRDRGSAEVSWGSTCDDVEWWRSQWMSTGLLTYDRRPNVNRWKVAELSSSAPPMYEV